MMKSYDGDDETKPALPQLPSLLVAPSPLCSVSVAPRSPAAVGCTALSVHVECCLQSTLR